MVKQLDRINLKQSKSNMHQFYKQIAKIYNNAAETGDIPKAMTHGILHPVPKPGKEKGPSENLRPVIHLRIIRKVMTIALLDRIWDRLATKIPKSQAAYQKGRGTTEQVLPLKILIAKVSHQIITISIYYCLT